MEDYSKYVEILFGDLKKNILSITIKQYDYETRIL